MEYLIFLFLIIFKIIPFFFIRPIKNFFKDGPTGDASGYFLLIQFFRNNLCGDYEKRFLPSRTKVFLPSLYLKIVGKLFSDKTLSTKSWLPNYILFVVGSFIFLYALIQLNLEKFDLVFISLIFAFMPDNININKNSIHNLSLQPRYLGILTNSLFWLIYIFFEGNYLLYSILVLFFYISINNSKFGIQTSLFTVVIYSTLSFDFYPLFILIGSTFISLVFNFKEFTNIIKGHYDFLISYSLRYYKPQIRKNVIYNLIVKTFSRPLIYSYVYYVFFINLILILCFKTYIISSNLIILKSIDKAFYLYLSVFIIFSFTSIRKFAFIGECWRYISFNTYFLNPIIFIILINELVSFSLVLLIIIVALILTINLFISIQGLKSIKFNKNLKLFSLLKSNFDEIKNAVWYSIPYRVATYPVSLGYGKKTIDYQNGNHSKEINKLYFSNYPFLKWDKEILKTNKISHVIVENVHEGAAVKLCDFSTDNLKLIDKNSEFTIYKLK